MTMNKYMKNFNGEKVFSLEYDKETLRDMVIEKQEEIERLHSIIKEVREYIDYFLKEGHTKNWKQFEYSLLEILDKENK